MISIDSISVSKKGRPKLPDLWTKVISFNYDNLDKLKGYVIATDLLMVSNLQHNTYERRKKEWIPHFLPK